MKHFGTKNLETQRLILRRFKVSDSKDMFLNWANDENVTKFLTWEPHQSIEETKQLLADWVKSYNKSDYYQWGIVLKEEDVLIGSIAAVKTDEELNIAEIGYCMGKKWWGKAIMAEALKRVIEFFFDEVEVKKVVAKHYIDNINSGKVMKKAGMTYEKTVEEKFKEETRVMCYYLIKNEK